MTTDTHYMTREYLETTLAQNTERIQQLEEHIQRITQRDYTTASTLQSMRDNMHEWTTTQLECDLITQEQAEQIADICGFELTTEVEAQVSVTYYITLQVPVGEEAEDIINDIDFDAITYDVDKVTYVSSSVDSIDI
jgi:chromosome segregation ATPase